jgi:hypothetical protein
MHSSQVADRVAKICALRIWRNRLIRRAKQAHDGINGNGAFGRSIMCMHDCKMLAGKRSLRLAASLKLMRRG